MWASPLRNRKGYAYTEADRVVRPYDGNTVYYFLKLSFRETERLKTMWSAVLSRLSRQK